MAAGFTRYGNGQANTLYGAENDDRLFGNSGNDSLYGRRGEDLLSGGDGKDLIYGNEGSDSIFGNDGADRIFGGFGDDLIFGGSGDDQINFNVLTDGSDQIDPGTGFDLVKVRGNEQGMQVRLTLTSSEIGNNDEFLSGRLKNQDGGLAVSLQAENSAGALIGPTSRIGDENVRFASATAQLTFDVRDLVSGLAHGNSFAVVTLGSGDDNTLNTSNLSNYVNAGMGQDTVTGGSAADYLVGSAGDDLLSGNGSGDTLIGGTGDDRIFGGEGNDTVSLNVFTDGSDEVDLGLGSDFVRAGTQSQVRLIFTGSEVGDGNGRDSQTMANQDGGLAVRLQAQDGYGDLNGPFSRFDDEGITFGNDRTVGGEDGGVVYDVRDLVSGEKLGFFDLVTLGTNVSDDLRATYQTHSHYINAGLGSDTVTSGSRSDYLVGGAGDDTVSGRAGDDTFEPGSGNDQVFGGTGDDTVKFNISTDGADRADLGLGSDIVNVTATAAGQVRLTLTIGEAGNGTGRDSGTLANQDGGLAVRLQAEDTSDATIGPLSRFGDEGITYVSATDGVTFDLRDLVTGAGHGELFEVVQFGTTGGDTLTALDSGRPSYINGGLGADTLRGDERVETLVGGRGNDTVAGFGGADSLIGGGGHDELNGGGGMDVFIFAAPLDALTNVDTVLDFLHTGDTVRLDSAVFTGLMAGLLEPGAFARTTEPFEDDDRIIYDQTSGNLFFDETGGVRTDAVLFATLENKPANLDATDFVVI